MKRQHYFGISIAVIAALLIYLLSKANLLHESVTAAIITPQNTIMSDPLTGFPQYDTRAPATVPAEEAFAEAPLDTFGKANNFPADPVSGCSCPIGYQKWKNAADNSIWCLPLTGAQNLAPPS